MKIIYLTNVRLPTEKAHGIQIMKMCEAFASSNNQVELVVPRRLNPLAGDPFAYYNVKNSFKITRLPCFDLISLKMGRVGYWVEMITFLLSAKVYLLFKKYDLLYTREFALGNFFRKYVLEVHDLPKVATKHHLHSWKKATRLIVLTKYLKEDLVKQGVEASKILVSPDGVDLDEFVSVAAHSADSKLGINSGQKIVMYTGSFLLYGWKGVHTLIEAASRLPESIVSVLIGGSKEEIKNINNVVGGLLNKNIKLITRIPHAEIPAYLKLANVLVLPNKKGDANSEKYTSPLKLFEYMASGVPIVAADLPSMREVLNEENCTFFIPGNVSSLVGALQLAIGDSVNIKAKARKALSDVREYTWKNRAQSILSFI